MSEQSVGIVVDCVCDLPGNFLAEHKIDVIYFPIETDTGVFMDTREITAENILSYIEAGGKKSLSYPPPAEEYAAVFERALERYGEVIHVAISAGVSRSVPNAERAVAQMGERGKKVHIFDSHHLSTGIAHVAIKAVEMAEDGYSAEEIIPVLTELRERVSTTFLTVNADYLHRSGRVSDGVKRIVDIFGVHPVLAMKDGKITLQSVLFGNYDKASLRYVRKQLKKSYNLDEKRIFLTHAGCSVKKIETLKEEINRLCRPKELIVTKASATVSSSCGPDTFGVLFVKDKDV